MHCSHTAVGTARNDERWGPTTDRTTQPERLGLVRVRRTSGRLLFLFSVAPRGCSAVLCKGVTDVGCWRGHKRTPKHKDAATRSRCGAEVKGCMSVIRQRSEVGMMHDESIGRLRTYEAMSRYFPQPRQSPQDRRALCR